MLSGAVHLPRIGHTILLCYPLSTHTLAPCTGCKLASVAVVYTPWANLKKTGDMAVGQISFHNQKQVGCRTHGSVEHAIIGTLIALCAMIATRLSPTQCPPMRSESQVKKINIDKKTDSVRRLEKTKVEEDTEHFIEERRQRDRREIEDRKKLTKEQVLGFRHEVWHMCV